ncbi:ion channel [Salegentibacter chungangensis]|uniref:Ion channel n=1 Tax=Salegentibacter chungangensis TaxID=1335724 RepID=A0ABW3NQ71_9FLAO
MGETFYLISGTILLVLLIYDFFFTTLSGSGAGLISRPIAFFSHWIIKHSAAFFGRRVYSFSGMFVNLMVLAVWIFIIWIGLYFIFSSDPAGLTNGSGRIANSVERLYYTGYTLSTLGLGDFQPKTSSFKILTSLFSFFGFIFFTSSMTYLISVSAAVTTKRSLARSIQNLGKTPQEIATTFLNLNQSYSSQQIATLQELIDRHAVNHQAYPVVHFYSHRTPEICLSINITRLDEALSILLSSKEAERLHNELRVLRRAVTQFLNHIDKHYSRSIIKTATHSLPLPYQVKGEDSEEMHYRRSILGGLLQSESFTWKDVSAKEDEE